MAEIKSTMEMVLARAEKLAAAADSTDHEELLRKGMRIAADFLNDKKIDLAEELEKNKREDQGELRKGILKTLLRNVVLPRDEMLRASSSMALKAIKDLADGNGAVLSICQELTQLLDQYNQHKEQTKQQLEDAIRNQLRQQMAHQDQEDSLRNINPAMHPQYREELAKILSNLNAQYNDAMDQRKAAILSQLV